MEIYRSPQSRKRAEKPRAIYYSRTRLIAGVVIWVLATVLFGAWEDMEENVYLDQSYMGLPVLKMAQIKTTLAKPRVKKLRVSALAMDSDEYMALCDSYSQGGLPPATR